MVGTGTALAIAGGLGALKTANDASHASAQRKLQAETTRYSPWTGMQAAAPKPVDMFGNMLGAGATALSMNQLGAPSSNVAGVGSTLGNPSPWAGMDLNKLPTTALGGGSGWLKS